MYSNYEASEGQSQVLPSIFVKIPAQINRQFQRSEKGDRIKAEDSFLFLSDAKDEGSQQSQTPPTGNCTQPPSRPESVEFQTQGQPQTFEDSNFSDVSLVSSIKCFKCELCPFISLSDTCFNDHILEHNLQKFVRRKIYCGGCENIFYEANVLRVHLSEDHMMPSEEATVLTDYIVRNNSFGPTKKGKKNRIFIKNVQTLKKPDLIESTEVKELVKKPPKSRIFVKSVQLLKNSETLTPVPTTDNFTDAFEFQPEQNNCPNMFQSTICIKSLEALRDPVRTSNPFPSHLQSPNYYEQLEDTSLQQFASIASTMIQDTSNTNEDPQSKSKIFIKNISVLQEPQQILSEQSPPAMTTVHFNSANLLNLNDNYDPTFESFVHELQQQRTHEDDVIILDENEINDLIEVNNNSNSVEMHNFTELLNDDSHCSFMGKLSGESINCEQKATLLSEQDVTVVDPNQCEMSQDADEEMLFGCAEEIINSDAKIDESPKVRKSERCQLKRRKNLDALEKCDINGCSWQFKVASNLDYHRKCHGMQKVIVCPECQNEFRNWNALLTHLWRLHRIDLELFSCEFEGCDFKTPILARLKNEHARIHSDEREFRCNEKGCDKRFKNAKQRKHHRRVRHKLSQKPSTIKCQLCSSTFCSPASLRIHAKSVHGISDEQPKDTQPKCQVCLKEFSSASALRSHLKQQHLDEKKYKCTACTYNTNDHNAYRRHKMIHSKSSCYQCPYCEYRSIQSTTYRKHLENKHTQDASKHVFKCSYSKCKFVTISRIKYDLHISTKHDRMEVNLNSEDHNSNDGTTPPPQEISKPRIRPADFAQNFGSNLII